MSANIALLRGVNVGGNNKLPMAALKAFCGEIGLKDARTLLQSGNLVFAADGRSTAELEALLEREAAERLGLKTLFHVRRPEEWNGLIAANPFVAMAKDNPSRMLLMVMKHQPDRDVVAALQAEIPGPEQIAIGERALYVTFPDGQGDSKASSLIDRRLKGSGTGRNWNTVLKLAEMVKD